MKKNIFIYIFAAIMANCLLSTSCKQKCKESDYTYHALFPQMETYFSVYKNGNWWVYKNQDSTKIDSIYVSDFNQQIVRTEKEICTEHIEKKFNLYSTYYYHAFSYLTSNVINGLYINTTDGHTNDISCGFRAHMIEGTDAVPTSLNSILYDSLIVANKKYFKVIYLEDDPIKTFHAPNVGMVEYIYQNDTFTLRKYF